MPRTTPFSTVTGCWLERTPDGTIQVERWPPAPPASHGRCAAGNSAFVLVNDSSLARESPDVTAAESAHALDIRDLFSLVQPVASAGTVAEMLGALLQTDAVPRSGARALAEAWPLLEARIRAWPSPLLETVAQLLASAGEAWRALSVRIVSQSAFALRAEELSTSQALLPLVCPTREKAAKRVLPDPADYEPLDLEAVSRWLEPDGPCARILDGYEHREGQVEMVRAVSEAFNTSRHLVVEAGTGIGKSVAYLLPAILWALRNHLPVVVSTKTKNLQSQLFHKDIPLLRHVLDQPFRAALIKGRMNYVCLRHVLHLLDHRETELAEAEFLPMAKVLTWLVTTSTGDLDELDRVFTNSGGSLLSRLPATGEECGGRACRHYARCLLQQARIQSLKADIVVANHALVFAECGDAPSAIPHHAHVVFDEAHNLEESATRHFTIDLSSARFAMLLRRLWRGHAGKAGRGGLLEELRGILHVNALMLSDEVQDAAFEILSAVSEDVDRLRKLARKYFVSLAAVPRPGEAPLRFLPADLSSRRWRTAAEPQQALRACLGKLQAGINTLLERLGQPDESAASPNVTDTLRDLNAATLGIAELAGDFDFVTQAEDGEFVFWLELQPHGREAMGQLHAAPVDIAGRLAEQVFNVRQSVVLCSATLSVNGSFRFLAHRIGLDLLDPARLMTCQATSPFDYTRQCQAVAAAFLPDPADRTGNPYPAALADFLVALLQRTRGRTLVLFTSYDMMRTCARILAEPLRRAGITLLMQGEGASRERLTHAFRRDVSSVLLGTDSFWEGVDVMGESLSCVVIARLPFDAVKDPLISARCERIAREGGDPFRNFSLPNAIISFRQGFGRLIRHREDRGVVIVADRRVFSKSYGLHFRRNLPCPLRNCPDAGKLLDDAERFLAQADTPPRTISQDKMPNPAHTQCPVVHGR